MAVGITSAQIVPSKNLSTLRVDPKSFEPLLSSQDPYALMILEIDTNCIRVIPLDQEQVTKVSIEASSISLEVLMGISSVFSRNHLSVIFCQHAFRTNLRFEVFIRENDVSSMVLDLERMDNITKVEVLELHAS